MKKLEFVIISLLLIFFTACSEKKEKQKFAYPQAIVALSPAAAEILFELGAANQIAAVSDLADYPPEVKSIPKAGGFDGKTISIERILSFKPDLVYLTDGMHDFLIDVLERNDIPYYLSKANSIQGVLDEILDIGGITGHQENADKVTEKIKKELAAYTVDETKRMSVYYEIWNEPYMTAGSSSYINEVIAVGGGINIFGDLTDSYPIVSEESIVARNPELILIPFGSGITVELVYDRKGWQNISAVVNKRVYIVDDDLFSRPGPRLCDAISLVYSKIVD